jgi:hypothetical protein
VVEEVEVHSHPERSEGAEIVEEVEKVKGLRRNFKKRASQNILRGSLLLTDF